ncbi:MAG: septum formation initiator family protein [Acidobacteriota bacterium]|nr:septum formation initiator family protein [Acidobacteriota bacterium]
MNWLRQSGRKLFEWRRLVASAMLGGLAALLFAHAMLGPNGWIAYRHKQIELQRLQEQTRQMEEENKRMDQEIRELQTNPKAIEKVAREDLRMAKPGEYIVLMPDKKGTPAAQPTVDAKK